MQDPVAFRKSVKSLPLLPVDVIEDAPHEVSGIRVPDESSLADNITAEERCNLCRRAHLVLSLLVHAYVWCAGDDHVEESIPASLAVPW